MVSVDIDVIKVMLGIWDVFVFDVFEFDYMKNYFDVIVFFIMVVIVGDFIW